jgi:tetratricopeptide (TPR) repeat protein
MTAPCRFGIPTLTLAFIACTAIASHAFASSDLDDARRLVAEGEYAAALKSAKHALRGDARNPEAIVLAAEAEMGLEDYGAAAGRLDRAPKDCAPCTALLAMADYLDADRNPRLAMPKIRARRRAAAEEAARAISAGSEAVNLHLVRTTCLLRLGDYAAALEAASAWERAEPGDAEAAAASGRIEAARARWSALDGPVDAALLSAAYRRKREQALFGSFRADGDGSEAKEIDALLAAERDRQMRAQLLVLRIAVHRSLGASELAVLEGWEAGYLDEKHAVAVARALRRLDPNARVDPALHLDGATKPEVVAGAPTGPKSPLKGGHIGADALYRVEPSGRVGPVLPLFGDPAKTLDSYFVFLKKEEFRPALRDGVPVAVPMHEELTFIEGTFTTTVPFEVPPW